MTMLAFFGLPGWQEAGLIAALALLIFSRRIPGVARAIGQSVVEFKRGLIDHPSPTERQVEDQTKL